ncbi:hypothetical protein Ais01nite_70560 [Asanoa ishikariensis]|uniref:DUF4132 domain-containing protein n=1 Tax=Asanoa ishikariensis TaxID=137265 RepID=A0A1H3UN11_9ACTN|nr:DUF4132 domain-containing protein [Asanoa ishikariensis]GIF69021.1 hypothetical protein Ais01nite_70560 [Asanoa ishikariensis]SDZ63768.1 protein of unknown function [Asanoa ishikariensis]
MGEDGPFTLPVAWRRHFYPRRGGTPGPALTADLAKADELVRAAKATMDARFVNAHSDPRLIAAGEAYLADPASGSPEGAAVVAALVSAHVGRSEPDRVGKLADDWVARHGVVFAARAALVMARMELGGYWSNGRSFDPRLAFRTNSGYWSFFPHWLAIAGRVRAYLAVASDDDYAAAIDTLAGLRGDSAEARAASSFLVPTQQLWVDADCVEFSATGHGFGPQLLWCSAATNDQATLIASAMHTWGIVNGTDLLSTAVDGVGPAILPQLLAWFDHDTVGAEGLQRLVGLVAQFPTDDAFAALVARLNDRYVPAAAMTAARQFPRRALRMLADAGTRAAADQLRVHVLTNQELAESELPTLPPAARARVEAILAERSTTPDALPEALPPVLVTPPWTVKRRAAKPTVLTGLVFTGDPVITWEPGEQEEWAATTVRRLAWWKLDIPMERAIELCRAGRLEERHHVTLMVTGPRDEVSTLLPDWRPERAWDADEWMPTIIATHGVTALPATMHVAKALPASCTDLLMPFASAEVAERMAEALARLKSLRPHAIAWLDRHPAYAARALTPAALGKPGPARRAAEGALRQIAARHRDAVLAAADDYGPAARAGVEELLGADALELLPARIPQLPVWAEPNLLPRILLADRSAALSPEAARHLCTMLAISKPGDVYAGVPIVREVCDRGSLAEFAWSLFKAWQAVGAPPKEAWPLHALRWIGDDETVRRLSPVIRAWPGEGGHTKALTGLDVLAEIGSDLALTHLHGIAQKAKFKGLKDRAGEKIAEVADGLGLTADQLADRLVPDLGLDDNGSLTLDYGPRKFVVGFDEQLKPYVVDESGARRKDLPKPGIRDEPALAPVAHQRFAGLKKDVRTLAADQIRRLEAAMVGQRLWSAEEFRDLFVRHPLLWHIVRRLVWVAQVGDGAPVAFRVAEDRSYADVDDDTWELPADAKVRVAHPLHLGAEAAATWSEIFADYAILQPFPQLGRPVLALSDAERAATALTRFADETVPSTTLLGLERRGWRRGEPQDGGVQGWFWRATPDRRAIVLDLDPGIAVGAPDILEEQTITAVWINTRPHGDWRRPDLTETFDTLDAVTVSEMLRDLSEVLSR